MNTDNESRKRIVLTLEYTFVFFFLWWSDILFLMLSFWVLLGFWWNDSLWLFLHYAFHLGVSQIHKKLILHTVINVYPHNHLLIKGCQFFKNFMCNATQNKSFGSWLTSFNEVRKCKVYIPEYIYIFFYRWLHYILWVVINYRISRYTS